MATQKIDKINLKPKKEKAEKKPVALSKENLILRIGVVSLAVLIFFLWAIVQKNAWQGRDNQSLDVSQDIQKILEEPVPEIECDLDTYFDNNIAEYDKSGNNQFKEDASYLLENIIKEVDKKVEDPSLKSCPAWINCMPTFDQEAQPCQIPVGCEDITQIAY